MEDQNKRFGWIRIDVNNTNLLRIGVLFLALVSFYTTANGMKDYIFVNNATVAYAASAAIQGILLALSMNLPGYLAGLWNKPKKTNENDVKEKWYIKAGSGLFKIILCILALLLTMVTLFCSSWFSYVYIADVIHQDSWGIDSELLVQQTYRKQLYDARDYAHTYRIYLEESLGEKILQLEEQAGMLSDSEVDFEVDWEDERATYTEQPTTASGYMTTVIDAMEKVFEGEDSQENRDLAAMAIEDAKTNIANRMENIQNNLNTLDANITNYNNQISNLTNRINRATEGTDTTSMTNAINNYTQLISDMTQQQQDLQTDYMQLDRALLRLPFYESRLGLSSSTSAISIRSGLMQIQSEFFRQEPDEEIMLDIATNIFDNLRSASHTLSGGGNGLSEDESQSYTNLLLQMNRLIQNLTDYSEIKDIELNLEHLIADLRTIVTTEESEQNVTTGESEQNAATEEPGQNDTAGESEQNATTEEPGQNDTTGESEQNATTEEPGQNDTTGESEQNATIEESEQNDTTGESGQNDTTGESELDDASGAESGRLAPETSEPANEVQWKREWGERLTELKAQINSLPAYGSEDTGNNEGKVLSENQMIILRNYDRNSSSRELDDVTRRYLSNHNEIYQGIIYLQSPYRSLAIFALILALSFDLSGFIFGLVVQGSTPQHEKFKDSAMEQETQDKLGVSYTDAKENIKAKWSVLKTLNSYIVLTGDYENEDGNYYYKTFKDGKLYKWPVQDVKPYVQGIYIQEKRTNGWWKGNRIPVQEQKILFAHQVNGPKDGIYIDCRFSFVEGSLIMEQEGRREFITTIDEYTPVHSYNPNRGENRTIPAKKLTANKFDVGEAVVALNEKGTRVAAVYMIEKA